MANWTNQDVNSLLPGEPWTSAKALAAFENPEAIAEGAPDAVVVRAGWHPYNLTNVGGTEDGTFYDHAVDGAVANRETPDLVDGYEYAILFENVSSVGSGAWQIALRRESDDTFGGNIAVTNSVTSSFVATGLLRISYPRLLQRRISGFWDVPFATDDAGNNEGLASPIGLYINATPDRANRFRVSNAGGNIDVGKLKLLRRREYITG